MNPFRNAYLQELTANQKKIDKNKNNKIDAHDFKLLRKEEDEMEESVVPAHMKGKQKPYVSSDGKGNYEVLGNTGQTKAEFSRKEHGKDAQSKAQAHLKSKYDDYMKEEVEELDELTKSTLASYAKKATKDARMQQSIGKDFEAQANKSRKSNMKDAAQSLADKYKSKSRSREAGIGKAIDRLAKEELTVESDKAYADAMKKREDIVKGMKKNFAGFKSKYGARAKEVMYATATKNAMKEEVLDEANHREFASQGKMHPDMAKHMKTGEHMDYYEPKTGDKVHGKVMKNDGKEVHVKQTHDSYNPKKVGSVHKFTVSSKLDEKKEDPPFDGPYTKVKDTVTDKSGAKHTPMSRTKHLAQQAAIAIAKKKVKEEFDMDITTEQALELLEAVKKQDIPAFLRKARGDKPLNLDDLKKNDSLSDKNNLAKARGVKEEVEELDESNISEAADHEHPYNRPHDEPSVSHSKLKAGEHARAPYNRIVFGGALSKMWHAKNKSGQVKAFVNSDAAKKHALSEEVEELDELSKTTIGSYVKKAKSSIIGNAQVTGMSSAGAKSKERAEKTVQKRASGINKAVDRLTKEETEMNSFKSYMQEDLDEAMWPGTPEYKKKFGDTPSRGKVGTSSATAKGTQTVTNTGVKHERDYEKSEKETSQPESGEKRGRGRPKGAASGARQKGSAAKADDRYDSTGFKLHLPNKNR